MYYTSKKTTKPFPNCSSVANDLKQYIPDYAKSENYYTKKEIYKFLKPQQHQALLNAESLEENREAFGRNHLQAKVFKLVQHLLSKKE